MKRKIWGVLGMMALAGMYVMLNLLDAGAVSFGWGAAAAAGLELTGALCLWRAGVVRLPGRRAGGR